MTRSFMLFALLLAASPASAQQAGAAQAGGEQAGTPASAANLALGADIAAKLLPDGTYQRIMGGAMSTMMDGITSQMTAMPLAPFLRSAGLPAADTARMGKATLKQVMEIVDPAYDQRMRVMMPVMMREMGRVMSQVEPQMRDGLAHAYAAHFTSAQLRDIDRFFNTPSGGAFASQNMTIASDPAVVRTLTAFMPTLVQALPGIMQKTQAAMADLPKAKTPQTLSDADRQKLGRLLGTYIGRAPQMGAPAPAAPAAPAGPDRAVAPVGNIAALFGPDAYPPAAMRAESQGRVVANLGIDPAGKAFACTIAVSSGSSVLDARTCEIAIGTMRFTPATDHKARPIAGTYQLPVRWVLPADAGPERAWPAPTPVGS